MKTIYLVIFEADRASECWVAVHDDAVTEAWRQYREVKHKIADTRYGSVHIATQLEAVTADEQRQINDHVQRFGREP